MQSRSNSLAIIIFLLSFIGTNSLWSRGYDIRIQIDGVSNVEIILGHYLNKSMYPDDTALVNSKGLGSFSGEKLLPEGMYIIYLPSGQYFQIMMGSDQDFKITTDTLNFVNNAKIEGSTDNQIFFDFQRYMILKQKEIEQLQAQLKQEENSKEKEKIRMKINELAEERRNRIETINSEYPDLFVSTFLTATLDIKVPDPPKNQDGTIDSAWQYHYYRSHYFDNFDPADGRLLLTPLYEDKVMNYLEKVVPQIPDTLNKEIDFLLDGALKDSTLFRFLLITLFNYYGKSNIMGMDAVQVHIGEKYYLQKTWWNDEKFIADLKDRISKLKPLLIGNVAPDAQLLVVPSEHFKKAEGDSALKRYPHVGELMNISDIKADILVLLFWEADCSHCKKAVPDLYRHYKDTLESMGVKVLAISTLFGEEGKEKWVDFVNKHKLYDWINAWNPYDYNFKILYDIRSTPQLFILNSNKEIIAKRIGTEQVAEVINLYKGSINNKTVLTTSSNN
jgi:hypothetical protein